MTDKGVVTVENKFEQSLIKYVGDEKIESKFGKLAKDFVEELEQLALSYNDENLSEKEMKNLIYSLDILLQNYFSFVPSDAYNSIGDISLYDHTKTTVAIATALRENGVHLQENIFQSQTSEIEKEEISLIAGDFPSIQKYIFGNIQTSESLSKRLRAKSLTVQLLNEAVVEYLCSSLEISRASVLMNA
ncbi:hypothetical protein IJM86_08365 [bacterium]|nr:hypothetical protein [bacterium]